MRRTRLIGLLLVILTLLVYLPVWHHDFVLLDDQEYVVKNRFVNSGLTWAGLEWAFTSFYACNWHPLTWLSHALDCELFGLDAGAHHLVNVLLHTANALLLWGWLYRLTARLWCAAMVAALFAWHPLHVESVAWIAERKDGLSTFFGLLTLLAFGHFAKTNSRRAFWLACVFFALSLMAKPMLVTLPFLLLLLDHWPGGRAVPSGWRERVAEKWPFFVLSAASCVVTFLAQRAEAVKSLAQYPMDLRLGNALLSAARYLYQTVWPADLCIFYPFPRQLPGEQVVVATLLLAGLSWLAWRERRRNPYFIVGWLWYLGTLVPVIGLVQVGQQAMADRYTYIPLIGVFVAAVWGAANLVRWLNLPVSMPAVISSLTLGGCLLGTSFQLRYWRDDEVLFERAVAVTQANFIAHINLGYTYERQGRRSQARVHYETALRIEPASIEALVSLGNFAADDRDPATALRYYETAMRLNPNVADVRNNLGTLLVELNRPEEAMQEFTASALLQPGAARPHYLMAKACLHRGDGAAAVTHFRTALQREPDFLPALLFLARTLAADPDPSVRSGAAAVPVAERANTALGGADAFALDTLAMAYAEAGRFGDAQAVGTAAVRLADAAGDTNALRELKARLQLYEARQAFRGTTSPAPWLQGDR